MKLFLPLLLLCFLFCAVGCDGELTRLRGSGNIVSQTRDTGPFTGISASNSVDVNLSQGDVTEVIVRVDDNIMSSVRTNVSSGILNVELAPGSYSSVSLTVDVTVPEIDFIELSNSATLAATLFQTSGTLRVNVGNSSEFDFSGTADLLDINAGNSSEVNAFGLTARECRVDASNSSKLKVRVTNKLTGSISNSSELRYRGDPDEVSVSVSNSADLIRE